MAAYRPDPADRYYLPSIVAESVTLYPGCRTHTYTMRDGSVLTVDRGDRANGLLKPDGMRPCVRKYTSRGAQDLTPREAAGVLRMIRSAPRRRCRRVI